VKIGLMVFLANERLSYNKRPYEAIRSVALCSRASRTSRRRWSG